MSDPQTNTPEGAAPEEEGFFDKVKDVVSDVADKVSDVAGDAYDAVRHAAGVVADKAAHLYQEGKEELGLAPEDDEPAAAQAPDQSADPPAEQA
jgi:hypothetical protein